MNNLFETIATATKPPKPTVHEQTQAEWDSIKQLVNTLPVAHHQTVWQIVGATTAWQRHVTELVRSDMGLS